VVDGRCPKHSYFVSIETVPTFRLGASGLIAVALVSAALGPLAASPSADEPAAADTKQLEAAP
jgi:hypothetical protein